MTCNACQGRLSAYIDGELAGSAMMAVRRHLDQCPACQAERDALASMKDSLLSLRSPEPEEGAFARLQTRLAAVQQPPARIPRSRIAIGGAVIAAAAVCLALALNRPSPAPQPVAESPGFDAEADGAYLSGPGLSPHVPTLPANYSSP